MKGYNDIAIMSLVHEVVETCKIIRRLHSLRCSCSACSQSVSSRVKTSTVLILIVQASHRMQLRRPVIQQFTAVAQLAATHRPTVLRLGGREPDVDGRRTERRGSLRPQKPPKDAKHNVIDKTHEAKRAAVHGVGPGRESLRRAEDPITQLCGPGFSGAHARRALYNKNYSS